MASRDEATLSSDLLRFDPPQLPGGATKVEVVVTDEQASRILNVVLEHGSGSNGRPAVSPKEVETSSSLEVMVKKQLEEADPDADDLLDRIIQRVERELISQVYSGCDHVKSRAAIRLGINRNTLLKKLRQFGEIAEDDGSETVESSQ